MRSSPGRSRAGSRAPRERGGDGAAGRAPAGGAPRRAATSRTGGPLGAAALFERLDRAQFPASLYLEGSSEPLKAALLADLRHAWAKSLPAAQPARVFRAAETGVEEILAAYQGVSLFSPRDLVLVLEIEDLGRSDKRIAALAAGLGRPAGESCLVLVESAAETPRKSLEPLRAACAARWSSDPPRRAELALWCTRRL